jgi:hypothetical protein
VTLELCLLLAAIAAAPFVAAIVGWRIGKSAAQARRDARGMPAPPRRWGRPRPASPASGELTPAALRAIDGQPRWPGR